MGEGALCFSAFRHSATSYRCFSSRAQALWGRLLLFCYMTLLLPPPRDKVYFPTPFIGAVFVTNKIWWKCWHEDTIFALLGCWPEMLCHKGTWREISCKEREAQQIKLPSWAQPLADPSAETAAWVSPTEIRRTVQSCRIIDINYFKPRSFNVFVRL